MSLPIVTLLVLSLAYVQKELQVNAQIVGGHDANIEDYPYQISLEINRKHDCGGSILEPNIVLTAAHCVFHRTKPSITLRAGSSWRETGGQVVGVSTICLPKKYKDTDDYDVAVLALNRPFQLGVGVRTIKLRERNNELPANPMANASGWGFLTEGGPLADRLQAVEVPKVKRSKCKSYYPGSITDRMICFGYEQGGKDTCIGDSGGPLVYEGKEIGVVSWGEGCARALYPGVYAKVANPDIHDIITNCVKYFHNPSQKPSSNIVIR